MELVQMTMQREAAHNIVAALGELGLVEFHDLNESMNAFQRQFATEIRRCDELERKLRFFEHELRRTPIRRSTLLTTIDSTSEQLETLDSFESQFESLESELLNLNSSLEQMQSHYNSASEFLHVLQQGEAFFRFDQSESLEPSPSSGSFNNDSEKSLLAEEVPTGPQALSSGRTGGLGYLAGVVPTEKVSIFQLLLFRITRGNMILRLANLEEPIKDPRTGQNVMKSVFIVFFSSERAREKIRKVCESMQAHVYDYPEGAVSQTQTQLIESMHELSNTISTTNTRREDILTEISSNIEPWTTKICKEKAIYHVMNMFDHKTSKQSVIAQAWVPSKHLDLILKRMKEAEISVGAQVESYCETLPAHSVHSVRPTFFETNKFTRTFQNIIDAYGIPRYKEVNPTPVSIITFPFLFAVMFGDVGHGILITLFSLSLILLEKVIAKAKLNEIVIMIFDGRYLLFVMGLFSIFTGLLYNECFALPFNFFWMSAWEFNASGASTKLTWTYPFGVDPAWFKASNKLLFYNSLKMKMSIILGVTQMSLGLLFSLFNHIHFKRWLHVVFEFVPEFIFLMFTFGYLCFMIFLKWLSPGNTTSLLTTLTGFFLTPIPWQLPAGVDPLYPFQSYVQFLLLMVALLQVPLLLFPKPIITFIMVQMRRKNHNPLPDDPAEQHVSMDEPMDSGTTEKGKRQEASHDEEDESFSGLFIHQMIHTIEFVLGAVSNTASYLRLWALSLAHSQLSDVFWTMTIDSILGLDGIVLMILNATGLPLFAAYSMWFAATFAVLLIMEALSAFLHALRLHWVEFQNKFYGGDGRKFLPFSFTAILNSAKDQQ